MVKNCPCTDADWENILTSMLRQEPVKDVQATASVQKASIAISIRKHVQGITVCAQPSDPFPSTSLHGPSADELNQQRLGSINLIQKEDEAIELFDWCGRSAEVAAGDKEALATATAKADELQRAVDELKAQLDELIGTKKDHEAELLEKFRDLLNEKKVKIREQQRIIAASSVDAKKLARSATPDAPAKGHKAGPSRTSKRKAAPTVIDEESDGGFEKMNVDSAPADEPQSGQQTTDDEETASEAGDEPAEPAPRPRYSERSAAVIRMGQPPTGSTRAAKAKEDPPPKRDLPFARKKALQTPARSSASVPGGSETESDDEL
jgi:hypothetical protein